MTIHSDFSPQLMEDPLRGHCSVPCRESAQEILRRKRNAIRSQAKGIDALLGILDKAEPEVEEVIYQLLMENRSFLA